MTIYANEAWKEDVEFVSHIEDLLEIEDLQKLDEITHHHYTTRLQHSLFVAYESFKWARRFKLDTRSIARAGLLHDFFLESEEEMLALKEGSPLSLHPKIALVNARKHTEISLLEENIILSHMFLCTKSDTPKYKESFVVTTMDKYCAIMEVTSPVRLRVLNVKNSILEKLNLVNA